MLRVSSEQTFALILPSSCNPLPPSLGLGSNVTTSVKSPLTTLSPAQAAVFLSRSSVPPSKTALTTCTGDVPASHTMDYTMDCEVFKDTDDALDIPV